MRYYCINGLHSLQSREWNSRTVDSGWRHGKEGASLLPPQLLPAYCLYLNLVLLGHAVLVLSLSSCLSWVTPCDVALPCNFCHLWRCYWSFGRGKKVTVTVALCQQLGGAVARKILLRPGSGEQSGSKEVHGWCVTHFRFFWVFQQKLPRSFCFSETDEKKFLTKGWGSSCQIKGLLQNAKFLAIIIYLAVGIF